MGRSITVFCTLLLGLFTLEMLEPVQAAVVQPFTGWLATASAAMLLPFDPDVVASGRVIRHTTAQFAVSIEAGCNGIEAAIILIAGIIAFPGGLRRKIAAIVLGFLALQIMNIARIMSLFYLGQWSLAAFTWTHLYVWPVLIMLDVLLVFVLYIRCRRPGQTTGAGEHA